MVLLDNLAMVSPLLTFLLKLKGQLFKSLEKLKGPTWQVSRGVEGVNLDNGGRCQGVPPGRLATLRDFPRAPGGLPKLAHGMS